MEKYAKHVLEHVQEHTDMNNDQLCTIAQLTLWSGDILSAIRMYLSRDMVDSVLAIQQVQFLETLTDRLNTLTSMNYYMYLYSTVFVTTIHNYGNIFGVFYHKDTTFLNFYPNFQTITNKIYLQIT